MIMLFNDGPKTVDITIGKTSGEVRKPSDILINTSSVLLPLESLKLDQLEHQLNKHKTTQSHLE